LRALIDTNVALDLLQRREPFVNDAMMLFALAEEGRIDLRLSSDAISTIFYLVAKDAGRASAHKAIELLMDFVTTVPLDDAAILRANASPIDNLEDALVAEAALQAHVDALVTRDTRGFAKADIPVLTPAEAVVLAEAR